MNQKKKKEVFPYKYLRPDNLDELRAMSTSQLLKEHVREGKNLRALKRQMKEDSTLVDLETQIKEHRASAMTDDIKREILEIKNRLKEIREELDAEIEELLLDRKDLKKGYREQMAAHKERDQVVLDILEKRNDT